MMYLAAPMPSKCSELRTAISTRIHRAIHLSHLIALRSTKRNYDRKQSMAEVQLRQLLGSSISSWRNWTERKRERKPSKTTLKPQGLFDRALKIEYALQFEQNQTET